MGFEAKFNLATYQVGPALWERCHISHWGVRGAGGARWQNLNVKLQVWLGIQCRRLSREKCVRLTCLCKSCPGWERQSYIRNIRSSSPRIFSLLHKHLIWFRRACESQIGRFWTTSTWGKGAVIFNPKNYIADFFSVFRAYFWGIFGKYLIFRKIMSS